MGLFLQEKHNKVYGVYVIRSVLDNVVLYIGKGGTINTDGYFKTQTLLGRLQASRGKKDEQTIKAPDWFTSLVSKYGQIKIQYFILDKKHSPGFIETVLLQSYLNGYGKLPIENKSL